MPAKEAQARIKINKLLEEAGWRFFDDERGPATIRLEQSAKLTSRQLDALGDNFEKASQGFMDFLLLDSHGFPLVVLEAKAAHIHPLSAKEQARRYALSQECRWVILSNGDAHYVWNVQHGSPRQITAFPSPEWFEQGPAAKVNPYALVNEPVAEDYVVQTQLPAYASFTQWHDPALRPQFVEANGLRLLRPYQVAAVHALQRAVGEGRDRFLFEMATGTGKTLTSAAIVRLFLRTGVARRVLFLVDRLELEAQAWKDFDRYLKADYRAVIYKQSRDDWRRAEIVISTVQSFTHHNKYKRLFRSDDFDLVISDEAHRSIGGHSRAVFEYFQGYKLGLTATPRDYLKRIDRQRLGEKDPRELERRMLLDTYHTFGSDDGTPTFRYSLLDGVRDGYLINPLVVDARTDVTTQLLSDQGLTITTTDNETGEESEDTYQQRDFEKKFFSEATNRLFAETFLKAALRDEVSGEVGKTLVFCVSQNHAAKMAQALNEAAERLFPGRYQSDFAMQVTSRVDGAQQMTVNFANNKLGGTAHFLDWYRTSKTRVCVTVGMMTTGYDCPDLLNLCLMRPIFSPSEFVQIKGRGTRRHHFSEEITDPEFKAQVGRVEKTRFKLFDFFANCEFFEEKFNYDEVLVLPKFRDAKGSAGEGLPTGTTDGYENPHADFIRTVAETQVGLDGMKIDRMYFDQYTERVKTDEVLAHLVQAGNRDEAERYVRERIFDQPTEFYTLDKLRKALRLDRRLSIWESLQLALGLVPYLKSREQLLDEEFERFDSRYLPDEREFAAARHFFKSYLTDDEFRSIIETRRYGLLNTNPNGDVYRQLSPALRQLIPTYIKDHVSLNQFMD